MHSRPVVGRGAERRKLAGRMTFAIRRERTPDGMTVHLIGAFGSAMAAAVTQAIVTTPAPGVVVDLSELSSLDGEALSALLGAGEVLAGEGRSFSLVGASGDVSDAVRRSALQRKVVRSTMEPAEVPQAEMIVPEP